MKFILSLKDENVAMDHEEAVCMAGRDSSKGCSNTSTVWSLGVGTPNIRERRRPTLPYHHSVPT